MNLLDSLRRAVRHYPGGVDAVAARLGKSPSTLEKELRHAPQFKMGAEDAAEIAAMCMEHGGEFAADYPTRVAEAVGATLFLLPKGIELVDGVTARGVAELMRECADVVSAAATADADGQISKNELDNLQRQWAELVSAGQKLMQHMDAKHQATMAKYRAREGGAA
ncbi:MAG: transcriptional regulator [Acidovorax sp.]|nr:transcriptional regulator [Acidovorax sp.]